MEPTPQKPQPVIQPEPVKSIITASPIITPAMIAKAMQPGPIMAMIHKYHQKCQEPCAHER